MKFTIVLSALVAAVMAAPGAVPAELEKRCDANGGKSSLSLCPRERCHICLLLLSRAKLITFSV